MNAVYSLRRCLTWLVVLWPVMFDSLPSEAAPPSPENLPELVAALESGVPKRQDAALDAVFAIGPEARSAIPSLIKLLEDEGRIPSVLPTARTPQEALEAIGTEAVPALSDVVATGRVVSARKAVLALWKVGPRAQGALPALIRRLSDEDIPLRRAILFSLSRIDTSGDVTIPVLARLLEDPDEHVRVLAVNCLRQHGERAAPLVPVLISMLKDSGPSVRGAAATALGDIGIAGDRVVPTLTALLEDSEAYHYAVSNDLAGLRQVAVHAAFALAKYKRTESVEPLMKAMEHPDLQFAQSELLKALGEFGPTAADAVPLVLDKVRSGNAEAAVALVKIGPAARSVIGPLRELLASPKRSVQAVAGAALVGLDLEANRDVLQQALQAEKDAELTVVEDVLLRIGPGASAALPAILTKLKEADWPDEQLITIVGNIGPSAREAGPLLVSYLEDFLVGAAASEALVHIGPEMIPLLVAELTRVRSPLEKPPLRTIETLGRFGARAEPAVPALIGLLEHEDRKVRAAAAQALGDIGSPPGVVIPPLLKTLRDPHPTVRAQAASGLGHVRVGADTTIKPLIAALKDEYADVRAAAATALGELGPAGRPALPSLEDLARDPHVYVQVMAQHAAEKIAAP